MTIVDSTFLLAALLLANAVLFIVLGVLAKKETDKRFIQPRLVFFIFAAVYFGFAHFAMVGGYGLSVEPNNNTPCEWLVSHETVVNNTTTYSHALTCPSTTTTASNLYAALMTLTYIGYLAVFIGAIYLFGRMFIKRW